MSDTNIKETQINNNKENNDIKKRKFIENNNKKLTNNSNNSNDNKIKSINNNNNKNKNNKNKKARLKYTYDYNYKIISPFQKFLDYGICPTLNELYSEFYHILNESKCQNLKMELDELKRMNKSEEPIPENYDPSKTCHQHSKEDIEQIVFDPHDRHNIELTVRKFCGFLQKETNMLLMEIIILSIGLLKSIEFLHFTLEIERDGGIFTTYVPKSPPLPSKINDDVVDSTTLAPPIIKTTNTTTTTSNELLTSEEIITPQSQPQPISRRRTPGGIFFKLINLHIPTELKCNIFSMSSSYKYKNERRKKGFGTLLDLSDKLLDFTSNNDDNSNGNNSDGVQEQTKSKKFNKLLNEVDEEFDKLYISSN
ncbi:hypothetical protein RB653_003841 [Dictyostelium firmibasis]|uniref:Uncharacterized protein n=1 Tax=Dictyostelium firmibasis TaxID=79012 RepID=A0AAN7UI76_9MYCE